MTLFFFILINNCFGLDPGHPVPDVLAIGFVAYALAASSWVIYNGVGIKKHGFLGYLKLQSVPPASAPRCTRCSSPLEFFSNILVRPVTLALRLFANMFAGHLLLILFATWRRFFLLEYGGIGYVAGPLPVLGARHRASPSWSSWCSPAGLRLHPAERDVHLGCARRRALSAQHHDPSNTTK